VGVAQMSGQYGVGVSYSEEDFTAWCRQHFSMMSEGGTWVVPRSALIFQKRGEKLYLTDRGNGPNSDQDDVDLHIHHFAKAGIEIVDETR
jgi:hypothetical protein